MDNTVRCGDVADINSRCSAREFSRGIPRWVPHFSRALCARSGDFAITLGYSVFMPRIAVDSRTSKSCCRRRVASVGSIPAFCSVFSMK